MGKCRKLALIGLLFAANAMRGEAAFVTPLLEYTLNSNDNSAGLPGGAVVPNTGSVGATADLTMIAPGSPGAAANLYSVDGGGVSGLTGDRAYDNTIAAGMGSAGGYNATNRGPRATIDAETSILNGKTELTITGWLKSSTVWSGLAQVWAGDAGNFMNIRGNAGAMTFSFQTTSGSNNPASGAFWNATDQWMFFAVVWKGGAVGNVEYFNVDGLNTVQSVFTSTTAALQGAVTDTSQVSGGITYGLSLGNQGGGAARPYDGLLDNIRVFDGALTAADLQFVVNSDLQNVAVPEPAGICLALACVAGLRLAKARRAV